MCVEKVHDTEKAAMIWSDVSLHTPNLRSSLLKICTTPPERFSNDKNILSNQKQKKKIIHHSSSSIFVGFFSLFFQWSSIIHSHDGLLNDTFLFCSLGWEMRRFPGWHSGYEGAMPTEWYQRLKKKEKINLSVHALHKNPQIEFFKERQHKIHPHLLPPGFKYAPLFPVHNSF